MLGHDIECYRQLTQVVTDTHRAVAMLTLRELGLNITEWDHAAVDEFTSSEPFRTIDNENEFVLGDIVYPPPRRFYPAQILQGIGFELVRCETPLSYHLDYVATEADSVDAPLKVVTLRLHSTLPSGKAAEESAVVFIAPDSPPTAALLKDLEYADVAPRNPSESMHYDDIANLAKVRELFGDEAVETLSTEACAALITALRTEQARTVSLVNPWK